MDETTDREATPEALLEKMPAELRLLEWLSSRHGAVLGPAEAERALGGSKANWSPIMKRLAAAGYLEQTATPGRYAMGGRVFELGVGYLNTLSRQIAAAHGDLTLRVEFLQRVLTTLISAFPQPTAAASAEPEGQA